jgi:hypothetical protein
VDPLQKKYPDLTPYQFASNSPIDGTDLDGRERIDQRILQDKDGTPQLQTTATGPASKRYFHSFWEVSKVPPHYRVEYNQQHYWFAASTDAGEINRKHDGRLYIPIYSLEQYANFVKNPNTSGLVSEEQAQKNESYRIMYEGAEMALQALMAEAPSMLSAMRRGPMMKSTPSMHTNEQVEAANGGNTSRGMADPKVKAAADLGNRVHYDQLNGGPSGSVGLPTELQALYPNTQFRFTVRGAKGADVEVVGGMHPSQYPNSTWSPNNNFGDFKPGTPSGNVNFRREIKNGKLPANTQQLKYDPSTGHLQ